MRIAASIVLVVLFVAAGFAFHASRPEIRPTIPPAASHFDRDLVTRGAQLAAIGNCNVCHTAIGGHSLAGGLAMPTPFGTVYSTNITPDPDTGIGRWSEEAFRRAMRDGVDRKGRQLYPVFPYDHFTRVTDDDNRALYAYLMTRTPIHASAPRNQLWFPFNFRLVVAGWKLVFFREGPYREDLHRSSEWNRGAYLVEGLGHCGACHTPRNALGAERSSRAYAGGESEGWDAYALDRSSASPVAWTTDSLAQFFHSGWQVDHGVA
ncbi:MAG: cytochrome c, class, partial [Gammaproteobacteria bacterium]|nr:cytochrome c, class [Gammaproteobacteria bacterium]